MHEPRLLIEFLIALMACLTTVLLVWGLRGSRRKGMGRLESRLVGLGLHTTGSVSAETDDQARSRVALQRALQELESLKKTESPSALQSLLNSSGTERSVRRHLMISVMVGLLTMTVAVVLGQSAALGAVLGAAAGISLPILHLRMLVNKRKAVFAEELPGALDLIVRGIRAGLPLTDCLKMLSTDWRDPLKSEFVQVLNDIGVGLSIRAAVGRFADRVALQEARLFAIVISIQSQSGGNLSEVLSSLSDLLRERSKLVQKIRAMTSEARTSAMIIGAIPILIVGAVSLISPDFLQPLFETSTGNLIILGCALWMMLGMLVMRAMMRVDL
jgi:tight adherence protein B